MTVILEVFISKSNGFLVDKFEEKNLNCNLEKLVSQLVLRLSLLNEHSHERKHKNRQTHKKSNDMNTYQYDGNNKSRAKIGLLKYVYTSSNFLTHYAANS